VITKLNTKNVLVLVAMSTGLLKMLTGTVISQIQPAFADNEDECNDKGDDNYNVENQGYIRKITVI
jgi:hypothetical protein